MHSASLSVPRGFLHPGMGAMLELMGWQCRSWDGSGCHGLMVELRAMLELMAMVDFMC